MSFEKGDLVFPKFGGACCWRYGIINGAEHNKTFDVVTYQVWLFCKEDTNCQVCNHNGMFFVHELRSKPTKSFNS